MGYTNNPRDPHEWIDTKADRDKELSKAWNKGYVSGHSNAMRQMSDEPNAPTTDNPYRQEDDR